MDDQKDQLKNRFHFRVGAFNCLVINDGSIVGNAEMLFANAPASELEQTVRAHGLKSDHLPSTWSCLLVKTADHIVPLTQGSAAGCQQGATCCQF